jgi:hypothetical protein
VAILVCREQTGLNFLSPNSSDPGNVKPIHLCGHDSMSCEHGSFSDHRHRSDSDMIVMFNHLVVRRYWGLLDKWDGEHMEVVLWMMRDLGCEKDGIVRNQDN